MLCSSVAVGWCNFVCVCVCVCNKLINIFHFFFFINVFYILNISLSIFFFRGEGVKSLAAKTPGKVFNPDQ